MVSRLPADLVVSPCVETYFNFDDLFSLISSFKSRERLVDARNNGDY